MRSSNKPAAVAWYWNLMAGICSCDARKGREVQLQDLLTSAARRGRSSSLAPLRISPAALCIAPTRPADAAGTLVRETVGTQGKGSGNKAVLRWEHKEKAVESETVLCTWLSSRSAFGRDVSPWLDRLAAVMPYPLPTRLFCCTLPQSFVFTREDVPVGEGEHWQQVANRRRQCSCPTSPLLSVAPRNPVLKHCSFGARTGEGEPSAGAAAAVTTCSLSISTETGRRCLIAWVYTAEASEPHDQDRCERTARRTGVQMRSKRRLSDGHQTIMHRRERLCGFEGERTYAGQVGHESERHLLQRFAVQVRARHLVVLLLLGSGVPQLEVEEHVRLQVHRNVTRGCREAGPIRSPRQALCSSFA